MQRSVRADREEAQDQACVCETFAGTCPQIVRDDDRAQRAVSPLSVHLEPLMMPEHAFETALVNLNCGDAFL
eukprot:1754750-Rhodomonas_salina.6